MNYQRQWIERDDNVAGFVYLMEAVGYHGLIPGCFIRRCKIGLSRDPQKRLADFHSNQPPCDLRIIESIFVEDMAEVEALLHEQFRHCKVKLNRSREWFDLNPVQYWQAQQAFEKHGKARYSHILLPSKLVLASAVGLLGAGLLIHSAASQPEPVKAIPTTQTKNLTHPKVLHKNKYTSSRKNFAQ